MKLSLQLCVCVCVSAESWCEINSYLWVVVKNKKFECHCLKGRKLAGGEEGETGPYNIAMKNKPCWYSSRRT